MAYRLYNTNRNDLYKLSSIESFFHQTCSDLNHSFAKLSLAVMESSVVKYVCVPRGIEKSIILVSEAKHK